MAAETVVDKFGGMWPIAGRVSCVLEDADVVLRRLRKCGP